MHRVLVVHRCIFCQICLTLNFPSDNLWKREKSWIKVKIYPHQMGLRILRESGSNLDLCLPNFQDKWYNTHGKTWRNGKWSVLISMYYLMFNLTVHVSKFQRRQCIGNFSAQHLNKFVMRSNFAVAVLGIWSSSFLHAPSILRRLLSWS